MGADPEPTQHDYSPANLHSGADFHSKPYDQPYTYGNTSRHRNRHAADCDPQPDNDWNHHHHSTYGNRLADAHLDPLSNRVDHPDRISVSICNNR
jgi:hypothetical protein